MVINVAGQSDNLHNYRVMPLRGYRDVRRVADDDGSNDFAVLGYPLFLQDFGVADRGTHPDPTGPQASL